jgi:hypothetical protein
MIFQVCGFFTLDGVIDNKITPREIITSREIVRIKGLENYRQIENKGTPKE